MPEWIPDPRQPLHQHLDGVAWWEAPIPPLLHRCRPQSRGLVGTTRVFRCRCGAISPDARRWGERNSCRPRWWRRKGYPDVEPEACKVCGEVVASRDLLHHILGHHQEDHNG